jgi:citrate lyase subunit gamma (acyl carrier protein)
MIIKERKNMTAIRKVRIFREARAGFDERGDVLICLSPAEKNSGIQADIESKVMSLFGDQIRASVLEVIEGYGLKDIHIIVRDQGALDYAIRSRVQTAIVRACKEVE